MISLIRESLAAEQRALETFMQSESTLQTLSEAGATMAACLKKKGRIFSCGNGGSMSDAMHFAQELTGRFRADRPALAATAISDPGHISCVANDYGFEYIFSRYLEGNAREGDCLLAISTSGNSENVVMAAKTAKDLGMTTISLTGRQESRLGRLADFDICTPGSSQWADGSQELHTKCVHILIRICERLLFQN